MHTERQHSECMKPRSSFQDHIHSATQKSQNFPTFLMDPGSFTVKNTFIEVRPLDQNVADDDLPRAFSDQSHVRRNMEKTPNKGNIFATIPEDDTEGLSDRSSSIHRLDTDDLERLRTLSRPNLDTRALYGIAPPVLPLVPTVPLVMPTPLIPTISPLTSMRNEVPTQLPVGDHYWHGESSSMGKLSANMKEFTKLEYDGRLSMVTESVVHKSGAHRYLVFIKLGPVSVADGFGFVFSNTLPCKKNIQKIDSVFLNRKGRICSRTGNELEILNSSSIGSIEVGTIVELVVDLDSLEATFSLYSPPPGVDAETLSILVRDDKTFSNWLTGSARISMKSIVDRTDRAAKPAGHFCAVLKNINTTVRFL